MKAYKKMVQDLKIDDTKDESLDEVKKMHKVGREILLLLLLCLCVCVFISGCMTICGCSRTRFV